MTLDENSELAILKREFEEFRDKYQATQWTWMRGILSGLASAIPVVIALVIPLLLWGNNVNEDRRILALEVEHLKKADQRHEEALVEQKREVIKKLDEIGAKIEYLQGTVARLIK